MHKNLPPMPVSVLISPQVLEKLSADVGHDTLLSLLDMFIAELDEIHTQLCEALVRDDVEAILNQLHVLKNSSALYGAQELADVSKRLYDTLPSDKALMRVSTLGVIGLCERTLAAYRSHCSGLC